MAEKVSNTSNEPSPNILDVPDNFFEDQINPQYQYPALVVSVYDGDTITVNIDLGFGVELKKQKIIIQLKFSCT